MELTLNINEVSCTRCGHCVAVCPSHIFTQNEARGTIGIQNPQSCIVCGHCVAACPTGSVRHSCFPAETVHPIDRTTLPTPEQVMLLCRARRSNRAFSKTPVPRELLEQIVEAAHRAPTASNMQQVAFTVVTDPEKLRRITNLTLDIFGGLIRLLCGKRVLDVTSGFRATNARMTAYFARHYATDYPEPEAILAACLAGFTVGEAPVVMRERQGGVSSISSFKSAYYMIKVSLALIIDRFSITKARGGKG